MTPHEERLEQIEINLLKITEVTQILSKRIMQHDDELAALRHLSLEVLTEFKKVTDKLEAYLNKLNNPNGGL